MASKIEEVQPETTSEYILIDVLPKEHFEQIHLPGAANACVYEVTFIDQVKALTHDPEAKLLLYGDSATSHEASFAVEKLARAGYRNLTILQGGVRAWQDAGRPLEGTDLAAGRSATAPALPQGHYTLDTSSSQIGWIGRNPSGKHWGTLDLRQGELAVERGEIQGRFVLDLSSIKNIDLEGNPLKEVLIKHLLSDDFLYADRYPQATFTLNSAHPIPFAASTQPNYHLRGELALRGVTAPLDFAATVNQNASGEWLAEAHFDLDRTDWEIIYGSSRFFAHLGMHVVFDLVSVEITLKLVAQ